MLKPAENIIVSLGLLCILVFLTSCSSKKHLQPGETFLEENFIKIKSEERVRDKAILHSELENLYIQKETRVFVGIPRHWFYYEAEKKPGDSTGFNNLLRKIGDDPVILDTASANVTTRSMEAHLRQRGYWNGEVDFKIASDDERSSITYLVDPGVRWTVRSLDYVSDDPVIQSILDTLVLASVIGPGQPVDVDLYTQEKARLTRELQNRGYANFFQSYIAEPVADSSAYEMDLEIEVTTPVDSDTHQKYHIGKIRVYPNVSVGDTTLRDSVVNGISFMINSKPQVRPEVIERNIFLRPGDLYTKDAFDKTLRQLARLETYRFTTLRADPDPQDSTALNYRLLLVRNKKMAVGGDVEVNYSSLGVRSLLGLGGNLNFRNRNFLGGAELFSTNIELGVEFNLLRRQEGSSIYSANALIQQSLEVPKFIDPFGFYSLLNKIRIGGNGLLSDKSFEWLRESNSNVSVGYQFLSLFNLYDYHSLNATLGYDAQPDAQHRLQLNHIGVDFFFPQTKPAFDTILKDNVFLRESFARQLLTGFLFRDYRFSYVGKPKLHRVHYAVIHSAEISGLEVFGLNSLANAIGGETKPFELGSVDPLTFSHYAKFELDTRMYHSLSSNQQLAFRLALGVAFPYGPFSQQVPYIKQFYVGGPSSIRAWQVRELGPGGYEDLNVDPTLPFYQTGDVKIEFSAEYRFDLAWVFEGALFFDAGNVWTVQKDASRPGAVFSSDFLQQMAVGTGIGLRLDFTYFLIRLDFGYKLRNPYPDEEGKYWLFDNFKQFAFNQFTTNFAIGFPF